jgi:serine/threonine-protein kinase
MMAHQHKQPTPLRELAPDTPPELVAIVEKLMEKDPANRYGSCAEVIEALRHLTSAVAPTRHRVTQRIAAVRQGGSPLAPQPGRTAPVATGEPAAPARPVVPSQRGQQPEARQQPQKHLPELNRRPAPAPQPAPPEQEPEYYHEQEEAPETPARPAMGMFGLVLLAILAGLVAWLVTSYLKP